MDRRKFLKFGLASGATLIMTPELLKVFKKPEATKALIENEVCIDGVTFQEGDRILIKDSVHAGVYTINWETPVKGPWLLPNDEVGTARVVGSNRAFIMDKEGWVEFKEA